MIGEQQSVACRTLQVQCDAPHPQEDQEKG